MTYSYSKLFTIGLLHEYFLNGQCKGLTIIPSASCVQVAKSMRLLFRNTGHSFVALISNNGTNSPACNNDGGLSFRKTYGNTVLRFYIKIDDPLFLNYTNVNTAINNAKKYYFSNLSQNSTNHTLNLSMPVKDFAAGITYLPGDLVKDPATGNIFEALIKVAPKKKNQLGDASVWAQKGLTGLFAHTDDFKKGVLYQAGSMVKKPGTGDEYEALQTQISTDKKELDNAALWVPRGQRQLQYATSYDMLEHSKGSYIFIPEKPVTKAVVQFFDFNFSSDKPAYDGPVGAVQNLAFNSPVTSIPINFSTLPPGRYLLKVNDETRPVYYDPQMNGSIVGVIEIFNHLPEGDPFSFLTNDEKIKGAEYQVQFCTRSVLWKYILKDGRAQSISDVGDTGYVFNADGGAFVSATPIPLSQSPLKTLKLDFNTKDFSLSPLPNPGVQRLAMCTQNDYDYFCSEVFLNY